MECVYCSVRAEFLYKIRAKVVITAPMLLAHLHHKTNQKDKRGKLVNFKQSNARSDMEEISDTISFYIITSGSDS